MRWVLVLMAVSSVLAAAAARAQQRTFNADGWGPLRFTMSCDDARAALARSGRHATSDERVGIFPREHGFDERTFVSLTWREGSREARAECADFKLASVAFVTRGLSGEPAATAGLAPLVARYGTPSIDAPTAYGRVHGWTNTTTRLLFFVTHVSGQWMTSEEWTPVATPRSW